MRRRPTTYTRDLQTWDSEEGPERRCHLRLRCKRLSRENRLIYIACITDIEEDGDYYEKAMYEHRRDRIYIRGDDGRFSRRPDACYHDNPADLEHDLGSFPEYDRARVLISDDFRYFGSAPGSYTEDLTPYPGSRACLGPAADHTESITPRSLRMSCSDSSAPRGHTISADVGSPSPSATCTPSREGRRSRTTPSCG